MPTAQTVRPLSIVVDAPSTPAVTFEQLRVLSIDASVALPFDPGGATTRCNAALTDPAKIVRELAGVKVAMLSTTAGPDLSAAVDCALALSCPLVRVVDPTAAEVRAVAGRVHLAVELTAGRNRVSRLWHLIDEIHHPAVGACWTVDDTAAVAVPTLASVLSVVRLDPASAATTTAMHRLRGIGYAGPIVAFGSVDTAAIDAFASGQTKTNQQR